MARNSMKNICRLIDQVEKELPAENSFLNDLERSIELDEDKNKREPSKTYKPSGMNCMRQSYYQIVGKPQDDTSSNYTSIGICNSGTDTHERIQKAVAGMKANGFDCEYVDVAKFIKTRSPHLDHLEVVERKGMETKLFHKNLNISFMCDGIIKYKDHYYILELKTETVNKWFARKGVDESHYNQAIAYSLSFDIDEVIFVYISRDTLDMKSFMFNVTDEMKQDLVGYIQLCDEFIQKNKVPPKSENTPKKTCNYCKYKTQCRKDG